MCGILLAYLYEMGKKRLNPVISVEGLKMARSSSDKQCRFLLEMEARTCRYLLLWTGWRCTTRISMLSEQRPVKSLGRECWLPTVLVVKTT